MAIRLLLMPIALQGDIYFINVLPSAIYSRHTLDLYAYFAKDLALHGFIHYPPLVGYLTAFSQFVFLPVCPELASLTDHLSPLTTAFDLSIFSLVERLRFVFFMKLPYLIVDALCFALIWRISDSPKVRNFLVLFWLFHPVALYSTYIFGQYRIYTAFFEWALIYALLKDRKTLACLAFGAILLLENFAFMLLVPFVLAMGDTWRDRWKYTLLCILPFILVFLPLYVHSKGYAVYAYWGPAYSGQALKGIFLSFPLLSAVVGKLILGMVFLWVSVILLQKQTSPRKESSTLPLVANVWCALLLTVYATTMVSVHYFMWTLPFYIYLAAGKPPWPSWLSVALIFLLFLFNLDSRGQNLGLFTPLMLERANQFPSLHEILARYLPWGKVIGLSRLLFSAICLYMTYQLIQKRIRPQIA